MYGAVQDTRSCSKSCGCTPGDPGSCADAAVAVYGGSFDCTGTPDVSPLPAAVSGSKCYDAPGGVSTKISYELFGGLPAGETCTPGPGDAGAPQPSGAVATTDPTTICCVPAN
jgi:hypothetical protein